MQEARALRQFNRLWLARVAMQVVAAVWLVSDVSERSFGMLVSMERWACSTATVSGCIRTDACASNQQFYSLQMSLFRAVTAMGAVSNAGIVGGARAARPRQQPHL